MEQQQLALFDYATLDLETREIVQQCTSEIKSLMKRAAQDIIEIGQKLIEVKERLGHGNFGPWLELEFDFTWKTATRFMNVAEIFKFDNLSNLNLGPSVLYLLSESSTPGIAREEVLSRAEAGEQITYATTKETIDWHKEQAKQKETPEVLTYDEWVAQPIKPFEPEDLPDPTPKPGPYPTVNYPKPAATPIPTAAVPTFNQPNGPAEEQETEGREEPAQPQPPAVKVVQDQPFTVLSSSQNDSWRTPARYIEAARQVLNGIGLDPASSAAANETIKAFNYYTKEEDGLKHPWFGTVWLNPPYGKTNNVSNQGLFAHKLVTEYLVGNVIEGIILVNLYSGYGWFAPLRTLPICLVDHRISFIDPTTDEEGDEAKASSVFVYVGKDPRKFYQVFKQFGPCGQLSYDHF